MADALGIHNLLSARSRRYSSDRKAHFQMTCTCRSGQSMISGMLRRQESPLGQVINLPPSLA